MLITRSAFYGANAVEENFYGSGQLVACSTSVHDPAS